MRFCAILHFQEVLVFIMNNFHVVVCYWVTDCQLLSFIFITFTALYHFYSAADACILISTSRGIKNVPFYFGLQLPCFLVDFTLLVPMEIGMNTLQTSYKIYNFTLTVSPHYLINLKPLKTAHFEEYRHMVQEV